jgi:hypothetical protein
MRYFMDSVYLWQVTWPTWLLSKLSTSSFWFGHRLCIIFQSCIIYIYCILYINLRNEKYSATPAGRQRHYIIQEDCVRGSGC